MSQYAFPLNLPPVFSADNFFVSESNREAHALIESWPSWGAHAAIIYGPAGCGKSHLAHIWAQKSGAAIAEKPDAALAGNIVLEHIERLADERALLHLINAAKENKQSLLLTANVPPKQLPFTLPDLTSRLLALPTAAIAPADDAVLAAALRKQFSDRQLKVEEEVIAYIVSRMERSLAAVKAAVDTLDSEAMREKKSITVPFAKRALGY